MLPILYSQPFLSLFYEVQNLDTEGFQLAGPLLQCGDLMRDSNVGKVRIDSLYNLVVVVRKFLKLEIKVVQSGDKRVFDGSRLMTTNSSPKMRFTINRLRLCSKPVLQSNSLKRMFCSSLSRKEYL